VNASPPTSGDARNGSGSYRWWLVAMLWLVCFANYGDRQAIFSVFPPLQQVFALDFVQLGVIGSAFMWVYALFGPLAGWLCDRASYRWTIICALLFWSACTAATAFTHSYRELVLVRALGGLGEAFYFPAAMSMLANFHGRDTRSRAMSLHQSAVYVGSIAGGGLAAWLAETRGWRYPFEVFGAFGAALVLLLLLWLRDPTRSGPVAAPKGSGESFWSGVFALLGNPPALLLTAVFIGANFVAAIFLSWTPQYLYQKFHMSLTAAGFNGSAWLQAASIIGVVAGGVFADVLARRNAGGRIFTQAAGLLLGAPFLFLTGWTSSIVVVLAAMAGFGIAKGIYDANIWASLFEVVPAQHRGATVGLMNSLGWFGGGIATVAVAKAGSRFGFGVCLSATSLIYVSLGCVLLGLGRTLAKFPVGLQERTETAAAAGPHR
jgi:MFS family permease